MACIHCIVTYILTFKASSNKTLVPGANDVVFQQRKIHEFHLDSVMLVRLFSKQSFRYLESNKAMRDRMVIVFIALFGTVNALPDSAC
jgi:hypothetical protein